MRLGNSLKIWSKESEKMQRNGYLYETHMHTKQGSACGVSTGAEMARSLYEHGYSGAVVTDHFFNGNCRVDRTLPWDERVRQFVLGWEDCRDEGERLGLKIWFGFEYNWRGAEFLIHGLTPAWLYAHPDCDRLTPQEFSALVHADGGFVVRAHPFREASYIPRGYLFPNAVDAVEGHNGNGAHFTHPWFDEKAFAYARQFGFPVTAGTDVHSADGVFGMGMAFDRPLTSHADLIEQISQGTGRLVVPSHP